MLSNAQDYGTMDNLTFNYQNNSNKLMKVSDELTNDMYGFKDDAINFMTDGADDYSYDQNGNLTSDANKGITSITYNHLNLPTLVSFGSDDIEYIYDAMGTKLKKIVTQNSVETRIAYAGNYIYENGALQFFSHPEGYVTPDGMGGYDYVYQYKDHLGNVRLSYTDQSVDETFHFTAGIEGWVTSSSTPLTNTNQKLNFSSDVRYHKASKYYDVKPGVPIHIEFDFEKGSMLNPYFFVLERINGVWESNADRDVIQLTSDGHYELDLTPTGDHIRVYFEKANSLDNGTLTTCYIDNFIIYQENLEIVEENNYYPFGMEHNGYNVASYGVKNNLKTYQKQEFTEDLGLNTHEWRYRMSDPATGRFWQLDPLAENYMYNSTYAFQENKLGMGTELEGKEVEYWAMKAAARVGEGVEGVSKMVTGGGNLLNDAASGNTAVRKAENNFRESNGQAPMANTNKEMMLDGASQFHDAIPDKQEVLESADTVDKVAETTALASHAITIGSLGTTAPVTGIVAEGSAMVSGAAKVVKAGIHLSDGNVSGALTEAGDAVLTVATAGTGKFIVKQIQKSSGTILTNTEKAVHQSSAVLSIKATKESVNRSVNNPEDE